MPNVKHASVGYESGIYFLDILIKYGSILSNLDDYGPKTILGKTYHFEKKKNGGYENKATLIFQYEDFRCKTIY